MIDESGEGCRVNRHEDLTRSLTGNLFEHRLGRIPNDDDRSCDCYGDGPPGSAAIGVSGSSRNRTIVRLFSGLRIIVVLALVDLG